jgi:lipoate-protein ligase A
MQAWRWIESGPDDGATQMAVDRAVLECALKSGRLTFRVYRWKPYCISLGYHQSADAIDFDVCRRDQIDVVRRPTGGRAVFHAEEVTYAAVIPEGHSFLSRSIGEAYNMIGRGLAEGIRKLGVPAKLQRRSLDVRSHYRTMPSVSCFSAAAKHEVVVEGRKLVGSAQRRLSEGLLQHGSILTGDDHLGFPEYLRGLASEERAQLRRTMEEKTISIGQYLKRNVGWEEIVACIRRGLEEVLDIVFKDGDLSSDEKEQACLYREEYDVLSKKSVLI